MRKLEDYKGIVTRTRAREEMTTTLSDDDRSAEVVSEVNYRPVKWVKIPTGWLPVYRADDYADPFKGLKFLTADIPACVWYLHGLHWTSANDPSKLEYVGGGPPFCGYAALIGSTYLKITMEDNPHYPPSHDGQEFERIQIPYLSLTPKLLLDLVHTKPSPLYPR